MAEHGEANKVERIFKVTQRGILALIFWVLIALVIQMIAIFLGFLIEDKELPFITAASGAGLALVVFIVGFGLHLFKLITSLKK